MAVEKQELQGEKRTAEGQKPDYQATLTASNVETASKLFFSCSFLRDSTSLAIQTMDSSESAKKMISVALESYPNGWCPESAPSRSAFPWTTIAFVPAIRDLG